jgi:hypothetical protein
MGIRKIERRHNLPMDKPAKRKPRNSGCFFIKFSVGRRKEPQYSISVAEGLLKTLNQLSKMQYGGVTRPLRSMSVPSHSRRFDGRPATSGLPRSTDIIYPARLVRFVPNSEVVASFDHLVSAAGCCARAAIGPPVRCPSRRLRAIPKDDLLGQIDEGAQACGHVAASWIVETISGIRRRPLA